MIGGRIINVAKAAREGLESIDSPSDLPSNPSGGQLVEWVDPQGVKSIWAWDPNVSSWVLQTTYRQRWLLENWASSELNTDLWSVNVELGNGRAFDGDHCVVLVSGTQEDTFQFQSDGVVRVPTYTDVICEVQRAGNNGSGWRIHQRIMGIFDTSGGATDPGEARNEIIESSGCSLRTKSVRCDGVDNFTEYDSTALHTDLYELHQTIWADSGQDKIGDTHAYHAAGAWHDAAGNFLETPYESPYKLFECAEDLQPGYLLFTLRSQASDPDVARLELGNIWLRR